MVWVEQDFSPAWLKKNRGFSRRGNLLVSLMG